MDIQKNSIFKFNEFRFEHTCKIENYSILAKSLDIGEFVTLSKFLVVTPNTKNEIFISFKLCPKDLNNKLSAKLYLHSEMDEVITKFNFCVVGSKYDYDSPVIKKIFKPKARESDAVTIVNTSEVTNERGDILNHDELHILIEGTITEKLIDIYREANILQQTNIGEDFGLLFTNEEFCDVTLSASGKDIKAHKAILAARSPVFKEMFSHETEENELNLVEITDIDSEVLQDMLHFIYTGKSLTINAKACELLAAAEKYALLELKSLCEIVIRAIINVETSTEIILLAEMYSLVKLKKDVLKFIKKHTKEVMKTSSWQSLVRDYPKLVVDIMDAVVTK